MPCWARVGALVIYVCVCAWARVAQVRSLLASLVYMSPVWAEVDDAVTVQVWDGARFGSGCLQGK